MNTIKKSTFEKKLEPTQKQLTRIDSVKFKRKTIERDFEKKLLRHTKENTSQLIIILHCKISRV